MRFIWILFFMFGSNVGVSAQEILEKMTLEEKVGQLLMVHFQGTIANDDAKALIQDVKVGSIIYYNWANDLSSKEQVKSLSLSLQDLAKANRLAIPLLIATDQEGGRVSRLKGEGFSQFPSNAEVALSLDPDFVKANAKKIAKEMLDVGVNMNLAPVVDVNSNEKNIVIGDRSFGSDPRKVTELARKAIFGYREVGVIATLKHFPGHGDVVVDSHEDLPVVIGSFDELKKQALFPFISLAPNADAIMTAHLLVPALDEEKCTTLSKKTIDYLRKDLGFNGTIITDSLVMEGVLKQCQSVDSVAIRALNAGHDILLLGGKVLIGSKTNELTLEDVKRIHGSIVSSVKKGEVLEERVDSAVRRILKLKFPFP